MLDVQLSSLTNIWAMWFIQHIFCEVHGQKNLPDHIQMLTQEHAFSSHLAHTLNALSE